MVWQNKDLGAKFDYVDIPDDLKEKANKYRQNLVETAVEEDEKLMEAYLDGKEPSESDLINCIRKGTLDAILLPILTGSAFKNKGVQPLLDAVIDYLPSPSDLKSIDGTKVGLEEKVTMNFDEKEKFSALALK